MEKTRPRPVVLCILDGWGCRDAASDNAIDKAQTPFWDGLQARASVSELATSGAAVGLPEGQMGNSEVGHITIGSGRVLMQSLPRIDRAIEDGSLAQHPLLQDLAKQLSESGKACHILGLLSEGGVHSHQNHIIALAETLQGAGVKVNIHAFLDGRDVPPKSAKSSIDALGDIPVVTVGGRYFAMDRDQRWERVEKAYRAIALAEGGRAESAQQAIDVSYEKEITDEFVEPCVIGGYAGFAEGDAVIMANFRADRAREMMAALVDPDFDAFEASAPKLSKVVAMTEYAEALNPHHEILFPPEHLKQILGEVISDKGLTQLRLAETEKYAHVTFFFNGGTEQSYRGEERILVPSPEVATYDLKPEMAAPEVTDVLVKTVQEEKTDLIVVNYANTDMVGHCGKLDAAIKAVETIDACLARFVPEVEKRGGVVLITADHGNAEQMLDPESCQPHTAHTTNPVPFVVVGLPGGKREIKAGGLSDIAPTILTILGIDKPREMTGVSLIG